MSVVHIISEQCDHINGLVHVMNRLENVRDRISSFRAPFVFTTMKTDYLEAAETLQQCMDIISILPHTIIGLRAKYAVRSLSWDLWEALNYTFIQDHTDDDEFQNSIARIIHECTILIDVIKELHTSISSIDY